MQLCIKVRQILRCTIISLMAIPWRKINGKLKTIFLTSLRQFFHHISLSIFPRRVFHTIVCTFKRPQTESVMMFGSKNHSFHTSFHQRLCPLLTIQIRRIKRFRIRISISPFPVIKRVQTKMDKSIRFHLLPFHLLGFRYRKNRFRRKHLAGCTRQATSYNWNR